MSLNIYGPDAGMHDLCIPPAGLDSEYPPHNLSQEHRAILSGNMAPRHPDSARFHEVLAEIGQLHDKKQRDYGREDAPFANLEAASDFGLTPFLGTLVRMGDKFNRLKTYVRTGKLANEGVIDNLKDIAVYAIAEIVLFEKAGK